MSVVTDGIVDLRYRRDNPGHCRSHSHVLSPSRLQDHRHRLAALKCCEDHPSYKSMHDHSNLSPDDRWSSQGELTGNFPLLNSIHNALLSAKPLSDASLGRSGHHVGRWSADLSDLYSGGAVYRQIRPGWLSVACPGPALRRRLHVHVDRDVQPLYGAERRGGSGTICEAAL